MNNKLIGIAAFFIGAAIGTLVTQQYFKKKYEKQYRDDVDSVKETFSKIDNFENQNEVKEIIKDEIREKAEKAKEKPSIMEYAKMIKENGYTDYSTSSKKEPEIIDNEDALDSNEDFSEFEELGDDDSKNEGPYVIPPDEFGMEEDYETITLLYFADKVLTDEHDEILDNPDETVGLDSLKHFGEYEEDSVFVRNDKLKCDFEILWDLRYYSDVVKKKPCLVEVE